MQRLIKRLEQQPHAVKSQVAFLVALVVTGLVGFVWVTTLPARFSSVTSGIAESGARENLAALKEAVESTVPEAPQEVPLENGRMEEVRARLEALRGDSTEADEARATNTSLPTTTRTPNPKTGTPIMIEVVQSSSTHPLLESSNSTTPIRIEPR